MATAAPVAVRQPGDNPSPSPIPRIGLGTWELCGIDCRRAVATALELGYRHIDTAQGYDNEAEVGRALAESQVPRAQLFITTKVWPDHLVEDPSVIDASLERLQIDRLDLLLLHWPSPTLALERTVEALARIQEDGKARTVGVSNFTPRQLERALATWPGLVCDQVEMHPYLQQREIAEVCSATGLELVAYCPLARGMVARDPSLAAIASRHRKSPAQIVLRWLLDRGAVAIPKASSLEHLRENIDIFEFELSADEIAEITGLDRGQRLINPEFAPDWA